MKEAIAYLLGGLLLLIVLGSCSTTTKPRPLAVVLLVQCDRPLVIFGIASDGSKHSLDAEGFDEDQVDHVMRSVSPDHRYMKEVPCVSHSKEELPGGKHGVGPATEL